MDERRLTLESKSAIKMENITKRFGGVVANKGISLEIKKGEILSLLGENGSGKTTLMNMLSGIYQPDDGTIYVNDKPVSIRSPIFLYHIPISYWYLYDHYRL